MSRISHSQDRDGNTKYQRYANTLRIPLGRPVPPVAKVRTLLEIVWSAIIESPYISKVGADRAYIQEVCQLNKKKLDVILLLLERVGRIKLEQDYIRLVT